MRIPTKFLLSQKKDCPVDTWAGKDGDAKTFLMQSVINVLASSVCYLPAAVMDYSCSIPRLLYVSVILNSASG